MRLDALFVVLALLAPAVHGAVHRIEVARRRLPDAVVKHREAMRLLDAPKGVFPLHHPRAQGSRHLLKGSGLDVGAVATAPSSPGLQTWTEDSGYSQVGNVSVGTPPQTFQLWIEFGTEKLTVIGVNATYEDSTKRLVRYDKNTFNTSASSTYLPNDEADYESDSDFYPDGDVGFDFVQFGANLTANISLQVADEVTNSAYFWNAADGAIGLHVPDSGVYSDEEVESDRGPLLQQLLPHLDQPVFTQVFSRTPSKYGAGQGEGVISLGDLAPDLCDEAGWTPVGMDSNFNYPALDVKSVSTTMASGDTVKIDGFTNVWFVLRDYFTPINTSYQIRDLFVNASQAVWDETAQWYVVPADKRADAVPVTLSLDNGHTVDIVPEDYIRDSDGVSYLYVYGDHDQLDNDSDYYYWPQLGSNFLNNHCMARNIQTGEWSLSPALKGKS